MELFRFIMMVTTSNLAHKTFLGNLLRKCLDTPRDNQTFFHFVKFSNPPHNKFKRSSSGGQRQKSWPHHMTKLPNKQKTLVTTIYVRVNESKKNFISFEWVLVNRKLNENHNWTQLNFEKFFLDSSSSCCMYGKQSISLRFPSSLYFYSSLFLWRAKNRFQNKKHPSEIKILCICCFDAHKSWEMIESERKIRREKFEYIGSRTSMCSVSVCVYEKHVSDEKINWYALIFIWW